MEPSSSETHKVSLAAAIVAVLLVAFVALVSGMAVEFRYGNKYTETQTVLVTYTGGILSDNTTTTTTTCAQCSTIPANPVCEACFNSTTTGTP